MKNITPYILLISLVLFATKSIAQNPCTDDLNHAVELYNNGLYDKVFELLPSKIEHCKYKGTEKELAKKLLIGAAYESDEQEIADSLMLYFLKSDPYYKLQKSDPEAFKMGRKNFSITPRFSIGITTSLAFPSVDIIKRYTVSQAADYNQDYKFNFSTVSGFDFKYYFLAHWSLALQASISNKGYARSIIINDSTKVVYDESFTEYKVQPLLEYTPITMFNVSPYLFAGMYFSKYDINNGEIENSELPGGVSRGVLGRTFAVENNRNLINYGYIYGAGLKWQLRKFLVSLNVSQASDFLPYTKTDYSAVSPIMADILYIDDVFSFKSLDVNLGFHYIFSHKVKKKW